MRHALLFPFVAALIAAPALAATEPAAAPVASLQEALLASMKAGKAVPLPARVAKLLPVVKATHDLPAMAARVVGPPWASASAADRSAFVDAFTRHSTVAYAENFAGWSGEKFVIEPKVDARADDRLVKTAIVATGSRTALNYRMHNGGGWKIVDVFADGVSQIAVQRSEFASTVAAGGVAALTKKLDAQDEAKLRR